MAENIKFENSELSSRFPHVRLVIRALLEACANMDVMDGPVPLRPADFYATPPQEVDKQ